MSPSSLWAWHSYSWLCFLPSPRGQLSCKCPVSGENCTASRLRERLMATLLARTASLPSLSEPAASGESARSRRRDRESKCRHTQDHDNLHEPEPTFDHLIEREDTLGALSNGDIWRVAPPARVSPPPAARSARQRKIVSDESWRRRIEVGSPPTQGGRIRE